MQSLQKKKKLWTLPGWLESLDREIRPFIQQGKRLEELTSPPGYISTPLSHL